MHFPHDDLSYYFIDITQAAYFNILHILTDIMKIWGISLRDTNKSWDYTYSCPQASKFWVSTE